MIGFLSRAGFSAGGLSTKKGSFSILVAQMGTPVAKLLSVAKLLLKLLRVPIAARVVLGCIGWHTSSCDENVE